MNFILQPWQLFFMILASWVHSEQQKVIDFYRLLKSHWDVLAAIDFTTIEVWTKDGLVTY